MKATHTTQCMKKLISKQDLLSFPSIPKETSPNLRHLVLGLLQRNHKERFGFGETLLFIIQKLFSSLPF